MFFFAGYQKPAKLVKSVLKNTVYCAVHEMHHFIVNLTGPQQYSTAGYFQKNFYKLCCITQRKKGWTITVTPIEESDRYYQLLEHSLPTYARVLFWPPFLSFTDCRCLGNSAACTCISGSQYKPPREGHDWALLPDPFRTPGPVQPKKFGRWRKN